MYNQQTQNQPTQISQPTSFWDFRHKKIYQNFKEKAIDFFLGVVFFWIFETWMLSYLAAYLSFPFIAPYTILTFRVGPFLLNIAIVMLFLSLSFLKRRFIFWGIIFGILLRIFYPFNIIYFL